MQAISLKEDNTDSDQLNLNDLLDQMRQSQLAQRELARKIQELSHLIVESMTNH
jgi:hypothetical protein